MAIYGNMVVPSKASAGAGALPTDNSERQVYVPGGEVSGRFSDAAAQIAGQGAQQAAQGLGEFGRALGNAALKLTDVYLNYQETKAKDAYNRYVEEEMQTRPNWDKLQGANAVDEKTGVIAQKSQWQTSARQRYAEGLSDMARNMFFRQADHYDAGVNQWALQKTAREMEAFKDSTDKGTVSIATQRALNDPSYLPQAMGIIMAVNDRRGARKGWAPEFTQAQAQEDIGAMFAGAVANRIVSGDIPGAMDLFNQARRYLPADKAAQLQQSIGSGLLSQVRAQVEAGDIAGARQTAFGSGRVADLRGKVADAGAQTLNERLSVASNETIGEKYTWGQNDCSGHTSQMWQAAAPDSPAIRRIFGRDGEHTTAAEIMRKAQKETGKLYHGAELNASTIKGGWLLATTGQEHAKDGRYMGFGHIVTTFEKADGSVWVSEASGGRSRSGHVKAVPLQQWLAGTKRPLYGADLSGVLSAGQAGARQAGVPGQGGSYSAGGRKVYDISAPIAGAIETEAVRQGVDPAQVLVICQIESSGNMNDKTGNYHGLFQLSEDDTREFGRPGDNRHDQATNIRVGIAQWKRCMEEFKDPHIACVAYNRGIGATRKWLAAGGKTADLPPETQAYLKKYDRYMAGLPGRAQGQPQQAVPASAAKLSGNAKALYDSAVQGVAVGNVTRQQAEERLQELLENAKAKMSSNDEPTRRMAEGDYKSAQDALAAFRQQSSQPAPAPSAQAPAMQAPAGAPSVQPASMPTGGGFFSPAQQYQAQAMLNRGNDNEATKLLHGLKDAETKARLSGDTSMLEDIAGGLRALGSDKAGEVQRRVDFWKGSEQTRQWAMQASLPQLAEQIRAVDKQVAPETAKSLPVEELERLHAQREVLVSMAQERANAIKADPAQAADSDPGAGITEGLAPGDKARSRLAWQEKQGVGELAQRATTKAEAEKIKSQWDKAPAEQKASLLGELVKIYGENAPRVVGEIGIGPLEQDVATAVMADGTRTNAATETFRILALNPKEVPGFEEARNDEVQAALDGSEVYQAYRKHAQTTLDPASLAVVNDMTSLAKKAKKLGKSDSEIASMLDMGRESYLGDGAAVVIPAGMTEVQVEAGLKWAIEGPLKQFLQEGRPDLKGGAAGYSAGEELSRLKAAGVWVASPDGNGFIMMDSVTKKPVTNSRGQIFIVSREQIQNYLSHSGVELSAGGEDE